MGKNYLEIFDIIALFSVVTGLYNMSLNEGRKQEQQENEERLTSIENKMDKILSKLEEDKNGHEVL